MRGSCAVALSCALVARAHAAAPALPPSPPACPPGTSHVDAFELNGTSWSACEDLKVPGGALVLVPAPASSAQDDGAQPPAEDALDGAQWFPKGYSMYGSSHDEEPSYYLGLGKQNVTRATVDLLGIEMLARPELLSWSRVAGAIPPIKNAGPTRTFVGSRSAVADTTFGHDGEDASGYGFPPAADYVFNLTNIAEFSSAAAAARYPHFNGSTAAVIRERARYVNQSGMAEGLVGGGDLPVVVFYFPIVQASPYLPPAWAALNRSRYWSMVAAPTPDMGGSREQAVWFRFQQLECEGAGAVPGAAPDATCRLVGGPPQYWDTYWWSRAPPGAPGGTNATGPAAADAAGAAGFYGALLANRRWWGAELAREGMMALSLPSDGHATATNGSRLDANARHNLVLSMVTKHDTWGPRYGVNPGYGITMQNGFEDVFTSTAQVHILHSSTTRY